MPVAYETITYAALQALTDEPIIPVYHLDEVEKVPRVTAYIPGESPLVLIMDQEACLRKHFKGGTVRIVLVKDYPASAVWPRWLTHREVYIRCL